MLWQARPKTSLRVGCIAAFEYLARLEGATLGRGRRVAIAHACDFGSLRDEYYDEAKLDWAEYRSLRAALRKTAPDAATVRYIRELRRAERGRPHVSAEAALTIAYRETVIRLSLEWMRAIAGLSVESARFDSIVSLVCLMQLVDDLLDWKEDQADGCPSYVTAFLAEQLRVAAPLRALADALLQRTTRAAHKDMGCIPFAIAGLATWACAVALLRLRFGK